MKIDNILNLSNRLQLREWLSKNYHRKNNAWIIVCTKSNPLGIAYLDIVEECLCFGWIDGVKKKTSNGLLAQRISPRRMKSNWTELNKERCRRLIKLDLMSQSGYDVLPDLTHQSFKVLPEILGKLRSNPTTYSNYLNMPDLYIRVKIDNIQSVYNDSSLYEKRLAKFLIHTEKNQMYGQWNDDFKLLNY